MCAFMRFVGLASFFTVVVVHLCERGDKREDGVCKGGTDVLASARIDLSEGHAVSVSNSACTLAAGAEVLFVAVHIHARADRDTRQ